MDKMSCVKICLYFNYCHFKPTFFPCRLFFMALRQFRHPLQLGKCLQKLNSLQREYLHLEKLSLTTEFSRLLSSKKLPYFMIYSLGFIVQPKSQILIVFIYSANKESLPKGENRFPHLFSLAFNLNKKFFSEYENENIHHQEKKSFHIFLLFGPLILFKCNQLKETILYFFVLKSKA